VPYPGSGGHDGPRHSGAEGLTEDVAELKSRSCPALLARRGGSADPALPTTRTTMSCAVPR
jgi:hypothetical protein